MERQGTTRKSAVGGMESQKRANVVVEMLLDIVELEAGILHRDFHGTFGNADVQFRKEVKSADINLSKNS